MAVGRINRGFFYKEMYGHFCRAEKCGRNNKVIVLPEVAIRRGSNVLLI